MDGVLVDGEPLHFRAVNALLAEDGLALTIDQYRPYMGTKAGWRELIRDLNLARPYEHYQSRYDQLILAEYERNCEPLPGAVELVEGLGQRRVPVSVASSSARPWVEACLTSIGLAGAFDTIVTGSDVDQGKPAPDIYLLAAERFGVPPARCLAFEDAPAGVASARAAGMVCWAVRTEFTRDLPLPGAARIFESLTEVDLDQFGRIAA